MSNIQESKETESVQKPQANPCLLTYRFSTEPEPLQTSTSQTSSSGRINLSVSASTAVYCNKIEIAVPIGSTATDYSEQTPSDSVNTAKWSLSSMSIKTGKELGIDDSSKYGVNYATFTFETRAPADNEINYNLVFGLSADVNQAIGEFDYIIQETSGTTSDPATFTPKKCSFNLAKALPQFYLKNLVATTTAAPTVPSTEFANAAGIRLSWESNGTFFQLFEKNKPAPIYAGSSTSFTVAAGAATDTTFILVASVTGNPDGDSGAGYEPIYLYESITITISNPDLTPKSNAVAENETIGGTLGVTGDTTLSNAALSGTLGVASATTLANATVNGTLNVAGAANAVAISTNALSVNGNAGASGTISAGALSTGGGVSSAYVNTSGINSSGRITSTVGANYAGNYNANGEYVAIYATNVHSAPQYTTGIYAKVATSNDSGLVSNGRVGTSSATSIFTHIPTRKGHRVVTSPLSTNIEVQLSGRGTLSKGKTTIMLEEEFSDIILYCDSDPYKVLLTANSQCNGLAVVEKTSGSFTVEELAKGRSNATFDWFLIAAKPESLNAKTAHAIPDSLPEILEPAKEE